MTPMTIHCVPSARIGLPTIAGSAPNRRFLAVAQHDLFVVPVDFFFGPGTCGQRGLHVEAAKKPVRHEETEDSFRLVASDGFTSHHCIAVRCSIVPLAMSRRQSRKSAGVTVRGGRSTSARSPPA
jgi:hypothetical protein